MSILDWEFTPQNSGAKEKRPFKFLEVACTNGGIVLLRNGDERWLNQDDYEEFSTQWADFTYALIEKAQQAIKFQSGIEEGFKELANESNRAKLIPNYQQAPTFFAFSSNSRVNLQKIDKILSIDKKIFFENGSDFTFGGNDEEFAKFLVAYDKFKESERQRIEIETNCKIQNSFGYPKA